MVKTRTYINSFIKIEFEEINTSCSNKTQASILRDEFLEAIDALNDFIEIAED